MIRPAANLGGFFRAALVAVAFAGLGGDCVCGARGSVRFHKGACSNVLKLMNMENSKPSDSPFLDKSSLEAGDDVEADMEDEKKLGTGIGICQYLGQPQALPLRPSIGQRGLGGVP